MSQTPFTAFLALLLCACGAASPPAEHAGVPDGSTETPSSEEPAETPASEQQASRVEQHGPAPRCAEAGPVLFELADRPLHDVRGSFERHTVLYRSGAWRSLEGSGCLAPDPLRALTAQVEAAPVDALVISEGALHCGVEASYVRRFTLDERSVEAALPGCPIPVDEHTLAASHCAHALMREHAASIRQHCQS